MENQEKVKEYPNLSNYYLKISLYKQNFSLIGLNAENLDNSLYQFNITLKEFEQNSNKYKTKSLSELYDKTIELIEKGKYLINDNKQCISLSLFEGENFDINKDIQFSLNKSNAQQNETHKNALIAIINNMKIGSNNAKNQSEEFKLPKQINNDKSQNIKSLEQYIRDYKLKKRRILITSAPPNLNNNNYPMIEINPKFSNIISGYGENSYNVVMKNYNANRIKIITDYKLPKQVKNKDGETINPKINYFAIYDGHGGEKCCNFLNDKLHNYIFSSEYFPLYSIQAIGKAYSEAENELHSKVLTLQHLNSKNKLTVKIFEKKNNIYYQDEIGILRDLNEIDFTNKNNYFVRYMNIDYDENMFKIPKEIRKESLKFLFFENLSI